MEGLTQAVSIRCLLPFLINQKFFFLLGWRKDFPDSGAEIGINNSSVTLRSYGLATRDFGILMGVRGGGLNGLAFGGLTVSECEWVNGWVSERVSECWAATPQQLKPDSVYPSVYLPTFGEIFRSTFANQSSWRAETPLVAGDNGFCFRYVSDHIPARHFSPLYSDLICRNRSGVCQRLVLVWKKKHLRDWSVFLDCERLPHLQLQI